MESNVLNIPIPLGRGKGGGTFKKVGKGDEEKVLKKKGDGVSGRGRVLPAKAENSI